MRWFPKRLAERKLVHWAVAYLAGAWLVLQVLDLLAQPFAWPALVMRAATVLLAIGFLAALVIAWYHGERGAQRASGVELLMLTGILAIAAAAVAFVARGRAPALAPAPAQASATVTEQGSIAVLPFADMSAGRDQEYFADGLTEELLNVLAQLPELRVASRTSSFAYKGAQVSIDSIARALRVAHVLEGSVRRDGERVRITAQLINAGTGYHAWSESYDRDVGSVFAVQDEIAHAIVSALELKLGGGRAAEALAREETSDPEAHTLVLKATQLRRGSQRASIEEAIASLHRAIARDSGYARAWAILADTYTRMDYLGFAPRAEMVPKARAAAERARALDPQSADAEFALGMLARDYDWDVQAAEKHYRRAIELRPSMASAYTVLAWSLAQLGRSEEAIAAATRAVDLDPVQGGLHTNLGSMYAYGGQPERAVAAYRRALALDEDALTLANLALSYTDLGRYAEAVAAAERAHAIGSDLEFSTAALAYVHGRAGNRAEAERRIKELEARPIHNAYLLATAYAAIGERERVLAELEEAAEAREPGILDVAVDPVFAAYRDEPQVRALLERMRLRP